MDFHSGSTNTSSSRALRPSMPMRILLLCSTPMKLRAAIQPGYVLKNSEAPQRLMTAGERLDAEVKLVVTHSNE
jgi:hypothetical protein